jgi:general secretion pathway protein D
MKKAALALLLALVLGGCATNRVFIEGRELIETGDVVGGLARIEEALQGDPRNQEIRNYYLRHRAVAVHRYFTIAQNARHAGALDEAEAAYRGVLQVDPGNARALDGLQAVERERRVAPAMAEAQALLEKGNQEAAYDKAKQVLAEYPGQRAARGIVRKVEEARARTGTFGPQLETALQSTITIELRDAPVRAVLELISKRSGLNFIYDKDIAPDLRTTVFVRDTPVEEVLRLVLLTSQLERRVLNPKTLLIYPNTPEKAQAYKELVVRSFYLDNADARQTANMVRSLVKSRDVFVDEKLNLLVVRDTPEAIRVIEKLVATQDVAEAEVVLEVEVLEVSHSLLKELGVQWPTSVALGVVGAAGEPGQLTGREARNVNGDLVRLTVSDPLIALNLREVVGNSNVLANPRIRVKNREKARIHIGDKVPVVTTTAGATGFVSESVNYLEVGLKLEVEPVVHLGDWVNIRVGLEVSNITAEVASSGGTLAYQVGTRNAATVLRLRDGETQVLAGLINDEDRRSTSRVPALWRLPVLGRLFQSANDDVNRTEVVLLVTPRVVRGIERPGMEIERFNSGTELEVGAAGAMGSLRQPPIVVPTQPPSPPAPPGAAAPFSGAPPAAGGPPATAPGAPYASPPGSAPPR